MDTIKELSKLKKRIPDIWYTYSNCDVEYSLIEYDTMKAYMTEGMWMHPCGAVVDEGRDGCPSGEWVCSCEMCASLKSLILINSKHEDNTQ